MQIRNRYFLKLIWNILKRWSYSYICVQLTLKLKFYAREANGGRKICSEHIFFKNHGNTYNNCSFGQTTM